MHPYVLIPLLSAAAAGGLASAILAREPGLRANQLMALLLGCAGFWSLCEFFFHISPYPADAVHFVRWSSLGALMLSPISSHLMLTVLPEMRGRFRRTLRFAYVMTAGFVLVNVTTPWYAEVLTRSPWGWSADITPLVPLEYAALTGIPLTLVVTWLRDLGARKAWDEVSWHALAPAVPLLVATITDMVLPNLGFYPPRLGSTAIVAWGGLTFWTVYRFREPVIATRRFAREILATLPTGVVLLRLDGRIRACNEKLGELVGLDPLQLMGMPVSELLSAASATEPCPANDRECDLLLAEGGRIPVSVSHSTLRDEQGAAIGFVLVIRDLREVVALRGRLITSGRLAAVGQLAAGITHEINNPIAYVRSNIALMEKHWTLVDEHVRRSPHGPGFEERLDEGREIISESREGIDRVAAIVRDVGGFSASGPSVRELGDINQLLETAVRVASPQLRGKATVVRHYGESPLVTCVPQELMQVFLNLLLNASQAISGHGTIELQTGVEEGNVVVRIRDDGCGMSSPVKSRVFEAFFTTKPAGEGTGLGLSISRQIVGRHGGSISIESGVGHGTTFEVRLPARRVGESGDGEALPR